MLEKLILTGAEVVFPLAGFGQFSDAAGLLKFNRALAARVDVYQEKWSDALTALNESFFDLNGDFTYRRESCVWNRFRRPVESCIYSAKSKW